MPHLKRFVSVCVTGVWISGKREGRRTGLLECRAGIVASLNALKDLSSMGEPTESGIIASCRAWRHLYKCRKEGDLKGLYGRLSS